MAIRCYRKKPFITFIALKPVILNRSEAGEENGEHCKHVILIFRNGIHLRYCSCQPELHYVNIITLWPLVWRGCELRVRKQIYLLLLEAPAGGEEVL